MTLVVTAGLLATLSVILLGPVSRWLSGARWLQRSPRCGVMLWQGVGLGAILSGIGAGLALAVSRYRAGFFGGTEELARGIFGGHPLEGLGLYDTLGLTLAADLLIVLLVCFGAVTLRTIRSRARHRKLLDLVTYESPLYPGTEFLVDPRAVAYCLPGLRPRIVLSDGTVALLEQDELWAVIQHERGHAHEHHGLVMLPMPGLSKVFGWVPYASLAPMNVSLLLEMAADDFAARRCGRHPLAAALVEMATTGWAPSCALTVAGCGVVERVSRLLEGSRASKGAGALAAGLSLAAVAAPTLIAALA